MEAPLNNWEEYEKARSGVKSLRRKKKYQGKLGPVDSVELPILARRVKEYERKHFKKKRRRGMTSDWFYARLTLLTLFFCSVLSLLFSFLSKILFK